MSIEKLNEYRTMLEKSLSHKHYIKGVAEEINKKQNCESIFLVGCGGSLMVMNPCKYICEVNSEINVFIYNASEFYAVKPAALSANSVVIFSSLSGETNEVIKSLEYAESVGATTIAFSSENSTLGDRVDYLFPLLNGQGVNDFQLIALYYFIFSLIQKNGKFTKYNEMMDALSTMAENMVSIKEQSKDKAIEFAEKYKNEEFFLVVGSGINWGEVYTFATCNLEEMQWIKAQPVHSGEFFHGTFEVINKDTNIIIFIGEDRTRAIVKRVIDFSREYSENVIVIDTKDYHLDDVDDSIREYFSPFILSAVKEEYLKMLSKERNHPISERKYMGKVSY